VKRNIEIQANSKSPVPLTEYLVLASIVFHMFGFYQYWWS